MNANITKLDKLRTVIELLDQLVELSEDLRRDRDESNWLFDDLNVMRGTVYVELNKLERAKLK